MVVDLMKDSSASTKASLVRLSYFLRLLIATTILCDWYSLHKIQPSPCLALHIVTLWLSRWLPSCAWSSLLLISQDDAAWPSLAWWRWMEIAIPFHSTPSRAHCSWAKPVSWMSESACTCFVEYSTSSYSSSAIFPATCACFLEFKIILRQFHTVRKPWDLFWGYFGYLRDSFANTPARTSTLKTADR